MAECSKSFARSNTLDVHLKSCHSDIRKYRCTWPGCEASLKTKLGLSIHLQVFQILTYLLLSFQLIN